MNLQKQTNLKEYKNLKNFWKFYFEYKENNIRTIITLDESWFYFEYQALAMYASSSEKVLPRTSHNISSKKSMLTIAFRGDRLYCFDSLPKGTKFNQEYFIDNVLSTIVETIKSNKKKVPMKKLNVHMDNSKVHNGLKFVDSLKVTRLKRPHPVDFHQINCNFIPKKLYPIPHIMVFMPKDISEQVENLFID